jgi:hypothetical protein
MKIIQIKFLTKFETTVKSHTSDRMWRKNRADIGMNGLCYGVDLNRNFPIGFLTSGGSSNSCSSTYAGTEALSQVRQILSNKFTL